MVPADGSPGARAFQAECDVFGDGEIGEEGRLLINGGDAQGTGEAGRVIGNALASDTDLAAIGEMGPGDGFDEGGFARPIFTNQCVNFTRIKIKCDAAKRLYAGEGLGDGGELEQRFHGGLIYPSRCRTSRRMGLGVIAVIDGPPARAFSCVADACDV